MDHKMIFDMLSSVKDICTNHKKCQGCPFFYDEEKDKVKCLLNSYPEYWDEEKLKRGLCNKNT